MLVEQVYIFGWSILTGAILGLLFDLFRGLRWEGMRDIWVYIQDVIFWIVTALIIIVSAFLINQGELRGYMLIGYLIGAGFYLLLFSKFVLGALKFVNQNIRKAWSKLSNGMKKMVKVGKSENKEKKNMTNIAPSGKVKKQKA